MGKSKVSSSSKGAAAVTGPIKTAKAKVEEVSKKAAKAAAPVEKKKKKKVKEPTPEPVEESESEEDSEDSAEDDSKAQGPKDEGSSVSSESSEDESEAEKKPAPKANTSKKVNGASESQVNGKAKAVNGTTKKSAEPKKPTKVAEPETSDSSDSSDDEAVPAKFEPDSDADSDDVEDESEESESSADKAKKSKPTALPKKVEAGGSSDSSGSEEESDEESDEETGVANGDLEMKDGTSDSSEESEEEAPPKKRKADSDAAPMSKKPKVEPAVPAVDEVKNLFVGQLSWNVDDEWLAREFESVGEVVSARVITDRESGRSRGFGYVEFATGEQAQKALAEMQGAEVDGRKIKVDLAAKRDNNNNNNGAARQERSNRYGDQLSSPSDTLYVANLPFSIDNDMVAEAFDGYGSILGIRLPTDRETGAPKGFGYVQFGSVDEATAALNGCKGMEIGGRRPRLDFSSPRPSGDNAGRGDRGGRGGFGGRGRGGDRGGRGGGRGDRGGFGGRGRGGDRGGRGGSTNRGGFGDFQGKKMTF